MNDVLGYLSIIIIFLVIVIPLGYLRLKMSGFGTDKKIIKIVLITSTAIVFVFAIIEILDNNLPKHEVGINITIHNKNNSFVEINIDGTYYYIDKNETININNIHSFSGFIAIKTTNNARIWYYTNKKSVFKSNKNVKIIIDNNNIKIINFSLDITTFVKNYELYDAILDFLIKKRQTSIFTPAPQAVPL